jgi:Transposase.
MPSNNSKYSAEIREQTAKLIIESGRSATSVGEEMGIDKNTVCKWVRDYRRKTKLPSYAEEKGARRSSSEGKPDRERIKEQEREIKRLKKLREDDQETIEILKKSLHIFMRTPE